MNDPDPAFTSTGQQLATYTDFLQWAFPNPMDNTLRGAVAEYIVGLALGCVDTPRVGWAAYDLRTNSGVRIEVKSSGYLQTWQQSAPSRISFDTRPTHSWDPDTNDLATERRRQADVYVFCVFKHRDKETANPLDVDQWDFYVVSTDRLNEVIGEQKSIALTSLIDRVRPLQFPWADLETTIASTNHPPDPDGGRSNQRKDPT